MPFPSLRQATLWVGITAPRTACAASAAKEFSMKRSNVGLMCRKIWALASAAILIGPLVGAQPAQAQTKGERVPRPGPGLDVVDHEKMIVNFAVKNLGNKIGGGECTDLVNAALDYAGMKRGDNYSWGTKIRGVRRIYKPGYIIQFENCHFAKPDGTKTWTMPHHTSIVKSANGSYVTLLHQNAPKGGPGTEISLDLAWLTPNADGKSSSIQLYAPVKK